MDVSQAARYFDNTNLDGWNGTDWDLGVCTGNLQVFDRFISDRTFGSDKRNFTTGSGPIPGQYAVVRAPGGLLYMVEAVNQDVQHDQPYSHVYLLHDASENMDVMRVSPSGTRASGAPGAATETKVADQVFCNVVHYSSTQSSEHPTVRYGTYIIYTPATTDVRTSDWVKVGDDEYNVTEVSTQLRLKYLRAIKRGAS
jgi:hypothetical protein